MPDLIAKLEKLDGPSREVDREIQIALSLPFSEVLCDKPFLINAYTASLDAAVALVERVLPWWSWEARKSGFGNAQAAVWSPMEQPRPGTTVRADHKSSPAIALLIALLKAKGVQDGR